MLIRIDSHAPIYSRKKILLSLEKAFAAVRFRFCGRIVRGIFSHFIFKRCMRIYVGERHIREQQLLCFWATL